MCCAFIFISIMTMVSNFSVIFIVCKRFCKYFLFYLGVILVIILLTVTFFSFQSKIYFFYVFLKNNKYLLHNIYYAYFLYDQMPKLVTLNIHKEYVAVFAVYDFSGLFIQLSIFIFF